MMIKRSRSQDTPWYCLGLSARPSDRDLVCGLHQGQRSCVPQQQAGHMAAPAAIVTSPNQLLQSTGPSTYDSTLRWDAPDLVADAGQHSPVLREKRRLPSRRKLPA